MNSRYYSLDLIKVVLACLIVMHHFQQVLNVKFDGINFFGGRFYLGFVVEFFFIISGFLCTYRYRIQNSGKESFGAFFSHKLIRICPVAMLSVLISYLLLLMGQATALDPQAASQTGIFRLLCSMLFLYAGTPIQLNGLGINNPLWYLCVLFPCFALFYLCQAVARLSAKNKSDKAKWGGVMWIYMLLSLAGAGILFYQINLPWLNEKCGRGYASFFMGCFLASVWIRSNAAQRFYMFMWAVFWLLLCLTLGALNWQFIDNQWGICTYAFFPAILIVSIYAEERFLNRVQLPDRVLQKCFYCLPFGMYVWHSPMLYILNMIRKNYGEFEITYLQMGMFVIFMAWVAMGSYNFVEKLLSRIIKIKYSKVIEYNFESTLHKRGG